jgi:hypothetical protein
MVDELRRIEKGVGIPEIAVLSGEAEALAKDPALLSNLLADMDTRIKMDRPVKLSVFFTGVSCYLKDPMNLFQRGESGVGKSYDTIQSLVYFPEETKVLLGGISPKALIHDHGVLMNREGKPIDEDASPEKPKRTDFDSVEEFKEATQAYKTKIRQYKDNLKNSYTLIDLSNKILVFLETPEFETFRMLFPILSHDTLRYQYRFVDKTSKGSMRTIHVVLEGWPATIFLTTERKFMEELATRSFTVTPENCCEKIEAANELTNQKACYPWEQEKENQTVEHFREILLAVQSWFNVYDAEVVVPFEELSKLFPREIARDMRDYAHFMQFVKTITALHLFQRPILKLKDRRFVVATIYDVVVALSVYSEIFESTRTGTDQALLDFYHRIVLGRGQWSLGDLTDAYNENTPKKASSETVRVKLERLALIGYVDIQKSETDKRMNTYRPLVTEEQEIPKIEQKQDLWLLLKSKLKNGFEIWLRKTLANPVLEVLKKNSESETPLVDADLSDIVWEQRTLASFQEQLVCSFLQKKTQPKQPKTPEERLKMETWQNMVNLVPKVKELTRLTADFDEGKCEMCGLMGRQDWQVTLKDESWGLLCEFCGLKLAGRLDQS